ncbi:bifunctional 4-hydroxy-2-oxoglutarate aldolase/2-dehydro-3-deoxy-phosphogluconate aldolase [uncultured Microbacterium sp.]|uniref:bifunctional 4-hydroxy-2-oxoglutarate aldolase/2-dehydro-3-deoxy-phosphogluconate aldolase n=1 Tax=uncultured Microbacterium sp. TaxID=191216 RepID=UPI0035CC44F7
MSEVLAAIREQGVVAIVRAPSAERAAADVRTLVSAGLRVVEVSLTTPGALDIVREAASSAPPDVHIGVGTVLTRDDVARSADAGARFVVSPAFRLEVVASARAAGLDTLPGVATPTEALQALDAGSTMVKLFPASLWAPSSLRDVLVALPTLEVVPTGGVSLESAREWITAGAVALGIGSSLTKATDPAATARGLLEAIAAARE